MTQQQLEAELQSQGMTLHKFKSQLRKGLREQLLKQKVQQMQIASYRPGKADVARFYQEYRDSLPTMGESYRVSQLTISIEPSDSVRQSAFDRITKIRTRIDNGEDFEELAKQYSEGPNASQGGNLGFIAKGTLSLLRFEEKIFSLQVGEISEPFESRLGWHIVEVLARKDQKVSARQIFISVAPSEEARLQVKATLDSLRSTISTPGQFAEAVRALSTDNQTRSRGGDIGWITRYRLQQTYDEFLDTIATGTISTPIPQQNSWQLLYLSDKNEDRALTLEDDYPLLEEKTREIYAQKKLIDLVAKWRKETYIDIRL
jgi:peptidyl-prolyl cis-trans isomerase SurA